MVTYSRGSLPRRRHARWRAEGFAALQDLTMTVPTGAVYGLVGPNGSGKSTIIRHITGVYRQDAGEILVDGQPVYENPSVKARIAYIPDDVFYFPQAGVREMMQYYKGIYPSFDTARYEKLKEVFQLDERQPIRRMSKGMQKQAAFWLAMADAAERGLTVLVSSHNLRELEDVCDHVGILDHGHLLLERSLSELQENIAKVQLALPDDRPLPEGLNLVHETVSGRLRTLILRGDPDETLQKLQECEPLFLDAVPLSLEEIFIYELGGADYAVKDILL